MLHRVLGPPFRSNGAALSEPWMRLREVRRAFHEKHNVVGFDGLVDGVERGLVGHTGISAVATACEVDTRQRQALTLPST